jgi:hypothetical protein
MALALAVDAGPMTTAACWAVSMVEQALATSWTSGTLANGLVENTMGMSYSFVEIFEGSLIRLRVNIILGIAIKSLPYSVRYCGFGQK